MRASEGVDNGAWNDSVSFVAMFRNILCDHEMVIVNVIVSERATLLGEPHY